MTKPNLMIDDGPMTMVGILYFRPMEEEEISAEEFLFRLGPQLGKTFFGLTKPVLSGAQSALAKRLQPLFERYKNSDAYHINYPLTIESVWTIISPALLSQLKEKQPIAQAELSAIQKNNYPVILFLYLQMVQPDNIPAAQKANACQFFYQLLSASRQVYGVDLVEGQTELLHQIVQHKQSFK